MIGATFAFIWLLAGVGVFLVVELIFKDNK